jgi:hypothetical protein
MDKSLRPDGATLRALADYYRPHNERLFRRIGRDLGWHSDAQKYPYYHPPAGGECEARFSP